MSSTSLQLWKYRETKPEATPMTPAPPAPLPMPAPPPGLTEEQVTARIQDALVEAEKRWSTAAEQHEAQRREQLQSALQAFAAERARYFHQAEAEVVHLALAIARKILNREANLDPDLLAALVRIALGRMGAGPTVKLRLPPDELVQWQQGNAFAGSSLHYELAADPTLAPGDCVVESALGTANFGLNTQFKEIEQGMLDLLKLRPSTQTSNSAATGPATGMSG